jgi:uncharacterized protein YrrD
MIDIPIHAKVICLDGHSCGQTTYVVLNPVTETMTHVVVELAVWPHDERLVPIDLVTESALDHICLNCSKGELTEMDTFIETEFIQSEVNEYLTHPFVVVWPYHYSEPRRISVEHERIPIGELAVRRGARVEATDGYAGHVDGFLVDEKSEHFTHLVLREGHLWGKKDIAVPVSDIVSIEEDKVLLNLDKDSLEKLAVVTA